MTQRVFDVENEKDMVDLWDILPDEIIRIRDTSEAYKEGFYSYETEKNKDYYITTMLKINWHDKTEITRPIQEATGADVDKLCVFWNDIYEEENDFGILAEIGGVDKPYRLDNKLADGVDGEELWYDHARRLTKQEIEELC